MSKFNVFKTNEEITILIDGKSITLDTTNLSVLRSNQPFEVTNAVVVEASPLRSYVNKVCEFRRRNREQREIVKQMDGVTYDPVIASLGAGFDMTKTATRPDRVRDNAVPFVDLDVESMYAGTFEIPDEAYELSLTDNQLIDYRNIRNGIIERFAAQGYTDVPEALYLEALVRMHKEAKEGKFWAFEINKEINFVDPPIFIDGVMTDLHASIRDLSKQVMGRVGYGRAVRAAIIRHIHNLTGTKLRAEYISERTVFEMVNILRSNMILSYSGFLEFFSRHPDILDRNGAMAYIESLKEHGASDADFTDISLTEKAINFRKRLLAILDKTAGNPNVEGSLTSKDYLHAYNSCFGIVDNMLELAGDVEVEAWYHAVTQVFFKLGGDQTSMDYVRRTLLDELCGSKEISALEKSAITRRVENRRQLVERTPDIHAKVSNFKNDLYSHIKAEYEEDKANFFVGVWEVISSNYNGCIIRATQNVVEDFLTRVKLVIRENQSFKNLNFNRMLLKTLNASSEGKALLAFRGTTIELKVSDKRPAATAAGKNNLKKRLEVEIRTTYNDDNWTVMNEGIEHVVDGYINGYLKANGETRKLYEGVFVKFLLRFFSKKVKSLTIVEYLNKHLNEIEWLKK